MNLSHCPCGSGQTLINCCALYHRGQAAPSAEALMRSRYSAYVLGLIDYLRDTTLPAQQAGLNLLAISAWSRNSRWLGLEVERQEVLGEHASVTFTAHWQDAQGSHSHHEVSGFVRCQGRWYFLDPTVRLNLKRNEPCPCGSGIKLKKCCGRWIQ